MTKVFGLHPMSSAASLVVSQRFLMPPPPDLTHLMSWIIHLWTLTLALSGWTIAAIERLCQLHREVKGHAGYSDFHATSEVETPRTHRTTGRSERPSSTATLRSDQKRTRRQDRRPVER